MKWLVLPAPQRTAHSATRLSRARRSRAKGGRGFGPLPYKKSTLLLARSQTCLCATLCCCLFIRNLHAACCEFMLVLSRCSHTAAPPILGVSDTHVVVTPGRVASQSLPVVGLCCARSLPEERFGLCIPPWWRLYTVGPLLKHVALRAITRVLCSIRAAFPL